MAVKTILEIGVASWLVFRVLRRGGPLSVRRGPDWPLFAGLVSAFLFGFAGMVAFPFAEDNAALFWLSTRVMGTDVDLVQSQASPFYLTWLFQPSVVFRESQVIGNTAAVFKIVGAAFLLLSCFTFAHRHFSKWGGLLALLIFVVVLNSFIGDYGFFKSGKETPMGMVLLLAFFSLLIGIGGEEYRDSWSGWLLLGVLANLAIGFAAVSIPYLAVVYGFLLLLGRSGVKALAALLVTGFAVLPISFALMLDKSLVVCFLIHAAVCSVFCLLSRSRVLDKSVGRLFSSVARNSQFLKRWQNGHIRVPGAKLTTISQVLTVLLIAGLIADRAQTPWFWVKEWTGDLHRVGAAVHSEKDVATAADFLHGYFLILPRGDGRFVFAGDTAENQLWTNSKKDHTHSLNGVGGRVQKFDPGKGLPPYFNELPLGFALGLVDRETFGSFPADLNPTALLELSDYSIFCILGDKEAYGEIVDRIRSNQP